jgi:hypothetical protein
VCSSSRVHWPRGGAAPGAHCLVRPLLTGPYVATPDAADSAQPIARPHFYIITVAPSPDGSYHRAQEPALAQQAAAPLSALQLSCISTHAKVDSLDSRFWISRTDVLHAVC